MSDILAVEDEVNWRKIVELLREGSVVELPCQDERDFVRRTNQVKKRAEKFGIAVEVSRGDAILKVEPRGAVAVDAGRIEPDRATREARRAERVRRKEEDRGERERKR